ncbi:hypothetical protein LTR16_006509 [Cryomyces antarcticus]|uniref:Uncharacterized protein n=1 Tax=Cryomyces antarcticus TaxID=329879 RepID=A0ABR0KQE1_9PEZI|nr:hypothetical protein LTR60_006747 [Cryomyces antarcticus]KAK5105804.1 hypothetical protein LTR16_006509 [Cryomyces antarcticus]
MPAAVPKARNPLAKHDETLRYIDYLKSRQAATTPPRLLSCKHFVQHAGHLRILGKSG